jgi:hypothetical protein
MKKRNFYPRQVAKQLSGRDPETLDAGERAALRFFFMKGRKMGVAVLTAQADPAGFKSASLEESAAILANTNSHIFMTIR